MPKKQRIPRADFSTLIERRPQRFFGLLWTLSLSPLPLKSPDTPPRFAAVVSKKVAAHAVDRNRIKRTLRELCRALPHTGLSGHSYIFYAKKEARDATHLQHKQDITHLITQARSLPPEALAGYNS